MNLLDLFSIYLELQSRFLAHDMEEDNEDIKLEIYPWALGDKWRDLYQDFITQRDALLKRMNYRAVVSKVTCDEVRETFTNTYISKSLKIYRLIYLTVCLI